MTREIDQRIVQAFKAFGSLHSAVFLAHDLSLETKRQVYCSVVLGVLLYGVETWELTRVLVRKLSDFIVVMFVVLWMLGGLYSGHNILPLLSRLNVLV